MDLIVDFEFDAAHKLPRYSGKCKQLHGHRYKLKVMLAGSVNKETGMVIDFKKIVSIVKSSVIDILDHNFLNNIIKNPTAENTIIWIWKKLETKFKNSDAMLKQLQLWETPNASVIYKGSLKKGKNVK